MITQLGGNPLSPTLFKQFLYIPVLIITSLFLTNPLMAFDEEPLVPPSKWWSKTQLEVIPSYNEAYDSREGNISLKDFLIQNDDVRKQIDGTITREESKVELNLLYGFSENWQFSANIPFINRTQTSSLSIKPREADETLDSELEAKIEKTKENLDSKTVEGLGDIRIRTVYTFNRDISSYYRGSLGLKIPIGGSDILVGNYPIEIGDQQYDILSALHYTYYPFKYGIRHNFRFEYTAHLKGIRKTLEDEEGDYAGGNKIDFVYGVSYEHNNWFWGGEYKHYRGTGSTIAGQQQDDSFYINKFHINVGIGNLSDLEKAPVSSPYEIRLGVEAPFQGQNTPIYNQWRLIGILYF